MLSILKATTLFGLLSQSSGGISFPVKGDILSISNSYEITASVVVVASESAIVVVVDCCVVSTTTSSLVSAAEQETTRINTISNLNFTLLY